MDPAGTPSAKTRRHYVLFCDHLPTLFNCTEYTVLKGRVIGNEVEGVIVAYFKVLGLSD
jgi:hypothetical protein